MLGKLAQAAEIIPNEISKAPDFNTYFLARERIGDWVAYHNLNGLTKDENCLILEGYYTMESEPVDTGRIFILVRALKTAVGSFYERLPKEQACFYRLGRYVALLELDDPILDVDEFYHIYGYGSSLTLLPNETYALLQKMKNQGNSKKEIRLVEAELLSLLD